MFSLRSFLLVAGLGSLALAPTLDVTTQAPPLLDVIRTRLRTRSPRIERVTILEVRSASSQDSHRIVLARGVPRDEQFRDSLADELFGIFVANDSLTRVLRTVDLVPSKRWFDFDLRIERVTPDSIYVRGAGATYGDQPFVRSYAR